MLLTKNENNMATIKIVYLLLLTNMFSCQLNNSSKNNSTAATTTDINIPIGFKNLYLTQPLILRENTLFEEQSRKICKDWILKEESLVNITKKMKMVSYSKWHSKCYFHGCWYESIVVNDSIQFEFLISPSSHISLTNADTTIYFISEENIKPFINPCDCCE